MLSGISLDLRTTLTIIKLQLAVIKDKHLSSNISRDVDEMEKMLNEYLQFTSTGAKDKTETFDISELLNETILKFSSYNYFYDHLKKISKFNLIPEIINLTNKLGLSDFYIYILKE